MKKQSAGILLYRRKGDRIEVLLGHAGGPFWAKKDAGAWSIPKGEFEPGEDPKHAARREFQEETGLRMPEGELLDLGSIRRKDGKTIYIWAMEGDAEPGRLVSNTFELEWPPKSGQVQQFPEFDKAAWIPLGQAAPKLHKGQDVFLERLAELPDVPISSQAEEPPVSPKQASLF